MSSLGRDHARAVQEARLAAAQDRHLAARVLRAGRDERRAERAERRDRRRDERREQRRAQHRAARGWWDRLAGWRTGMRRPLTAVADRPPEEVAAELDGLLVRIAERIAEHGTASEREACDALADATRWTAPGAAAALADQEGAEVARLRAFGVLHGVAMGLLTPPDQAWLLDRLHPGGLGQGDLVA